MVAQKKGVIDIGSNSVRLLIADIYDNRLEVSFRALEVTRLGEMFSKNNLLLPGSIQRTVVAIKKFWMLSQKRDVSSIIIIATSAVREARNRKQFLQEVFNVTGKEVYVLSGEEEAYLSYRGAAVSLDVTTNKLTMFDLGGGSTEFVWQEDGTMRVRSFPVGVVKLKEMFGLHDQFGERDIEAAKKYLEGIFYDIPHNKCLTPLVAVGGTATTLSAINLGLDKYDPAIIHGSSLTRKQLMRLQELLISAPLYSRGKIPGLMAERADVIVAGVIIITFIIDKVGADLLHISEGDLMIGLLVKEGQKIYI